MTYKFFIIVFLIYVIPFRILKEIYLFDGDNFKIAKILNVLITLLMLWYLTRSGNTIVGIISNFDGFKENYQIESGLINANLTLISKIIHNCVNLFMLYVIFQLSRRNVKYRMVFIRLIPLLIILMTLELNRELFKESNYEYPSLVLGVAFLLTSIKFIVLFLIYNSKVFKKLMCLDDNKIKELVIKKV